MRYVSDIMKAHFFSRLSKQQTERAVGWPSRPVPLSNLLFIYLFYLLPRSNPNQSLLKPLLPFPLCSIGAPLLRPSKRPDHPGVQAAAALRGEPLYGGAASATGAAKSF